MILLGDDFEEYINQILDKELFLITDIFEKIRNIFSLKDEKYLKIQSYLEEQLIKNSKLLISLKNKFETRERIDIKNKTFYMYKKISKYIIEALVNKGIYKNHVENFNDPFDPYFKKYESDLKIVKELKNIRITSLSENKNNLLLWAHYGDNHKGICLGYKLEEIECCEAYIGKVEYKGLKTKEIVNKKKDEKDLNIFKSTNFMINEELLLSDIFFRKHQAWKYEEEYRLVYFSAENPYYKKVKLVEVIFGIDTTNADKELIKKLLNYEKHKLKKKGDESKITFYQTIQKEELNIEVEEI